MVKGYFQRVQRPVCWWVGPSSTPHHLDQLLLQHDFKADGVDQLLAGNISQLKIKLETPTQLRIEAVDDVAGLEDFAEVMAEFFGEPEAQHYRNYYHMVGNHTAVGDEQEPMQYFVGYYQDKPVATASYFLHDQVAGFFDCVTLPDYRRRGIGSAMMSVRFQQMQQQGIRWVVLSSSEASRGLYLRQGFKAYGEIKTFVFNPCSPP